MKVGVDDAADAVVRAGKDESSARAAGVRQSERCAPVDATRLPGTRTGMRSPSRRVVERLCETHETFGRRRRHSRQAETR